MVEQIKEFVHGRSGYANHGCRCDECKAGMSAYQTSWRLKNHDTVTAKDRVRSTQRSEYMKDYLRQYYQENKQELSRQNREWAKNNRERSNLAKKRYDEKRCAIDLSYRMAKRLRCRMGKALKGKGVKSGHTLELLGCTTEELRTHLQSRFVMGMTWDNYGKDWHIDHIIPCASFDLSKPEE